MRSVVTMITWNRLSLTRDTLGSFKTHNGERDFIIVDNGSTDETVKYLRKRHYNVLENDSNLGIFVATRRAWHEAVDKGYDYVLNLQNDFPCIRPVHFDILEKYMDDNPDVGFIQLNDKGRLLIARSDGTFKIRKKKRTKNYLTDKSLKFGEWQKFGDVEICKGNHHCSFNPLFLRASILKHLTDPIEKPRELQIMERFHSTGLKSAKVKRICFETVIRKREDAWIH